MLDYLKQNKIIQIVIIILLLPIICFFLNEMINFIFNLGKIVGTTIHNIACL